MLDGSDIQATYMLRAAPERKTTLLFGIEPRGVGTPDVESLHSYLLRVAYAHGLPPSKLVNITLAGDPEVNACLTPKDRQQEIARMLSDYGWGWGWGWDKHHGKSLIGTGPAAEKWAHALTLATGSSNLRRCSLRHLRAFVSDTRLLTDEPRVCMDCLTEDVRDGLPYERLIWRIAEIQCCPRHRRPLIPAKCGRPAAEAQDPYLRVKHPGVCMGCGSVGFRCVTDYPKRIGPGQLWRAQQAGELLARSHELEASCVLRMKQRLQDRFRVSGGLVALGERAGACRSGFSDWINGQTQRTSLGQFLDLAAAEGVSMIGIMGGKWLPIPTKDGDKAPQRQQKPARRVPHEALREVMTKAIREGRCASEVALLLNVDTATLAVHEDLYRQLRQGTVDRQKLEDDKRHRAALEEAEWVARRLLSKGNPPSLRRACAITKTTWYPSQLRAQALMVIRHTLHKGTPPRYAKIGSAMITAAAGLAEQLRRELATSALISEANGLPMQRAGETCS